jgi:hypothetical protein
MPLATLAAPSGVMPALDARAARMGFSRAVLLARAGLVQGDWDAIATALGGVNAANLRRLLNATHTQLQFVENSQPVMELPSGLASSASFNAQCTSDFGDLT